MKVIVTGATGMVGEGVLLECLQNDTVTAILMINRRSLAMQHPKLKEVIIPDFTQLEEFDNALSGYDACFFCAGISSIGMNEQQYTHITYTTTMAFAKKLAALNPAMVFTYVSGTHTDSTEKGRLMWARVKGKTENDLMKLPFRKAYNFRPGFMKPFKEQKNLKPIYRFLIPVLGLFIRKKALTLQQLGQAMIHAVNRGYPKQVLEIRDIQSLAKPETP